MAVIRRIFHEFVDRVCMTARIADGLNGKRLPSPGGNRWTARHVLACLRNKAYATSIRYRHKTGPRGKQWVRTSKGGAGVVTQEQVQRAREMLAEAKTARLP